MSLHRFWWGLGFVLVALAIFVCLVPTHELPTTVEWSDKVSHLVGHGMLALYFSGLVARRSWWKLFLWLFALGIAIELAQTWTTADRHGDWHDIVANGAGTLLGLMLGWLGFARWPQWAGWLLARRAA